MNINKKENLEEETSQTYSINSDNSTGDSNETLEQNPFMESPLMQNLATWIDEIENSPAYLKEKEWVEGMLNTSNINNNLPTPEELSKRFGSSFAKVISRLKEDITFEISSTMTALEVPYELDFLFSNIANIFDSSASAISLQLKDSEKDPKNQFSLQLSRVDIRIDDTSIDEYENPNDLLEDSHFTINKGSCRDLDENGIVANPGIGDEWISVEVFDHKNNRPLKISFKAYFQIPKIN